MQKRLLVVDDNPATLFAYRRIFESPEVEVDTADTLAQAKRLFDEHRHGVVITDLRLSGANRDEGLDLITYLREHDRTTKVILITAHGDVWTMQKAYDLGAAFYLDKPVAIPMLRKVLSTFGIGQAQGAPNAREASQDRTRVDIGRR